MSRAHQKLVSWWHRCYYATFTKTSWWHDCYYVYKTKTSWQSKIVMSM